MAQLKFVAPLMKLNTRGSKGFCVPKAIAELLELGERYELSIVKTEQGFEV